MTPPSSSLMCSVSSTTTRAAVHNVGALDLVGLTAVMERTRGREEVVVGLIDGPVAARHRDLSPGRIRMAGAADTGTCVSPNSLACMHGTFLAGIIAGRRESAAPAIAPGCTLLVRPIFAEPPSTARGANNATGSGPVAGELVLPSAHPDDLATAIVECISAGARVLNLSVALLHAPTAVARRVVDALDEAVRRGVLVVVAAGNQGVVGSSVLTRHSWVLPVVAVDARGRPIVHSNLAASFSKHGLGAPGDEVTSLSPVGAPTTLSGTSVAAPFVSGAIALLWSAFPQATATEVRWALTRGPSGRRPALLPPLLDAWAAYQALAGLRSSVAGSGR